MASFAFTHPSVLIILLPTLACLGGGLAFWLWRKGGAAFVLVFSGMAAGALLRFTLPGIGALSALDIAVVIAAGMFVLRNAIARQQIRSGSTGIVFLCFLGLALLSLLPHVSALGLGETTAAGAYLARLALYFTLYFLAFSTLSPRVLILCLAGAGSFLALAGFVQLFLVPDFTSMAKVGWDPHQGRLLSTWFDPNFVGGFFAFALTILGNAIFAPEWGEKEKILLAVAMGAMLAALFLTYSRSAYVMAFVALSITGLKRAPRAFLIGAIVVLMVFFSVPRMRERVAAIPSAALAVLSQGYEYGLDETSRLRVVSWQQGWSVFRDAPWFGVGYNTLRSVKQEEGFIQDNVIHSGSGWDSSLLTILTTTGMFGFAAYALYLVSFFLSASRLSRSDSPLEALFATGCGIALVGLLLHSFFVNSLLFPAFLVLQFLCIGAVEGVLSVSRKHSTSSQDVMKSVPGL